MLVLLWRFGEVYRIRTIRVHHENLPVFVHIALVGDLEGRILQALLERHRRLSPGAPWCKNRDCQNQKHRGPTRRTDCIRKQACTLVWHALLKVKFGFKLSQAQTCALRTSLKFLMSKV